MKKLLSALMAAAIFSAGFAQVGPPRPPRPPRPPHPSMHRPGRPPLPPRPPRPKTPDEVARDVDNSLRREPARPSARNHKYVKSNNGKHKGHYKKARVKRHTVVRKHR